MGSSPTPGIMIKWLAKTILKTVGIFIKMPNPFLPLMLPGGRQMEATELQEIQLDLSHLRDLDRMIKNLPHPEEGLKITLVGQGFCGDVVAHDGSWHLDKGFTLRSSNRG